MTAWWAWVGHDARRHWRSVAVLAVLLAIGGGVVLSAFIGARRDATAIPRLAARVHPTTAMALPNEPGFDWAPVAALPYVRSMQTFAVTGFDVVEHPEANADFPRVTRPVGAPMEMQVALAGRVPDQSRADEIAVSEGFHERTGIGVGDELTLRVPGPGVVAAMITGRPPPDVSGTDVRVHVVGVAKGSFWNGDVQTTVGFYQRYREALTPPGIGYVNALLLLDGGATSLPRLQADLERIAGRPIEAVDFTRFVSQSTAATDVETTALFLFAVVATVVTVVLGGIAVVRSTARAGGDLETLGAIGFTRRQMITASAARPAAAAVVGAVGAVVIADLLSGRYPIGVARYLEPTPGRHTNVALLAIGATVLAAIGVGGSLLAAWSSARPHRSVVNGLAPRPATLDLPSLSLPLAMGWRLALTRRGGRSATVALAFGVAATTAALTFGVGLERGSTDGTLSGQPFDSITVHVGPASLQPEMVTAWRDDDRVAAVTRFVDTVVTVDGRTVAVFALSDVKGRFDDHPLRGRVPAAVDEISFAPTEMARLGVDLGDIVTVGGRSMRVVGELFTPAAGHTSYDEGGRVTPEALDALVAAGNQVKFDSLALRAAPGVPADVIPELWHGLGGDRGGPVEAQQFLRPTRPLPRLLAAFVIVLTVGAAGYAIAGTARRRRREVAVLQVLGLTRRQARTTVVWHTATAVVVALAIGFPLGFAVGRTLWQGLADGLPLRYVRPDVGWALAAVAVGVLLLGSLLALRPALTTARDEPAALLRAE